MWGERFYLFAEPVDVQFFDGAHDTPVEEPTALLQQAAVGHLVGQRVLEGVLEGGEQLGLVEQFGRLQPGEETAEVRLGQVGDRLERRKWHVLADDGRRLEQSFILRRQGIDPGREDARCARAGGAFWVVAAPGIPSWCWGSR